MPTQKKIQKLQAKLELLQKYGVRSASPVVKLEETEDGKENILQAIQFNEREVEAIAKGRGLSLEDFMSAIDNEVNSLIKGDDESEIVPFSEPQLDTLPADLTGGHTVNPEAQEEEQEETEKALEKEEKNAEEIPPVEEEAQPASPVLEETPVERLKEPEPKKQAPQQRKTTTNRR